MASDVQVVIYRGFRLNIHRHGRGWAVTLFKAEGKVSEPTVETANRQTAVSEAQSAIDQFFASMRLVEEWSA